MNGSTEPAVENRAGALEERPARVASALSRLPATLEPDPSLLQYYAIGSLALGPFFLFLLIPSYFKYRTLRYRVEDEGITMRWGILFRKEISLTFARIQDIHLSSNILERWLGLAKIQVQTASGNASAEMVIEGLTNYGEMRDFLYTRMRGARDRDDHPEARVAPAQAEGDLGELAATLEQVATELRTLRETLRPPLDGRGDDA